MFSSIKSSLRRRKLARLGIAPSQTQRSQNDTARNTARNSTRIKPVFYGDRTGIWPVCTDVLSHPPIVYSFGLGDNISWELELIKHHGAQVFAFDPTPMTTQWIQAQQLPSNFHYSAMGLGDKCGTIEFYMPRKTGRFNYSVVQRGTKYPEESVSCPVSDLMTLCQHHQHRRIDILKLDIEGSEMTALPGILNSDLKIGQLLVEFHYNYPGIRLTDTVNLINKIRALGFELFWLSDRAYEFGFVQQSQDTTRE